MSRVSTYLNFPGTADEAFTFYAELFGTDVVGPTLRYADVPELEVAESERSLVMHAEVEILAGHILMATDMLASLGHECRVGNNTTIALELDDRAEVDRLYGALSQGSTEFQAPQMMFWGQYWCTCLDRFGVRWMIAAH
ncbi:MAG: VOC family protein [Acidimicrobiales bacterium]